MSDGANLLAMPDMLARIYQIATQALTNTHHARTLALREICTLIETEPGTANETPKAEPDRIANLRPMQP
jgi:hypothetical protein